MKQEDIGSWFRHSLTLGAGYLVGKGVIDAGMADGIVSALMVLAAAAWSWKQKRTSE